MGGVNPVSAARAHLQTRLPIGHQKGDRTVIGMRARADLSGGAGARGIVQHPQRGQRIDKGAVEMMLLKAQIEGDGAVDIHAKCHGRIVIGQHRFAKSGQVRPLVHAAKRVPRQHARIVGGQIKAHVEAFLAVRLSAAFIQRFQPVAGPAPVMRRLQDRNRLFLRLRQREEQIGHLEDARRQGRVNPVSRQQEKSRPPRCRAQIGDEPVAILARGKALPVQNRDHAGISVLRLTGAALPMSRSILTATLARCAARLVSVELSIR